MLFDVAKSTKQILLNNYLYFLPKNQNLALFPLLPSVFIHLYFVFPVVTILARNKRIPTNRKNWSHMTIVRVT